jgi:hypothetical protein
MNGQQRNFASPILTFGTLFVSPCKLSEDGAVRKKLRDEDSSRFSNTLSFS